MKFSDLKERAKRIAKRDGVQKARKIMEDITPVFATVGFVFVMLSSYSNFHLYVVIFGIPAMIGYALGGKRKEFIGYSYYYAIMWAFIVFMQWIQI